MKMALKHFSCPLCNSSLTQSRYFKIIGIWEAREKLENSLKQQLEDAQAEKKRLLFEKKTFRAKMQEQMKAKEKAALVKGMEKGKARFERQSKTIEALTKKTQIMQTQMKQKEKIALERGMEKGKARFKRQSKTIEALTEKTQVQNKRIKELQEQLKKGTTPQVEGLNLEKELARELRREFPEDIIDPHGKNGDILQRVNFKNKQIGSILYECKKTTKYSPAFVDQTKRAKALRQATHAVLVTTVSKKDTAGFWVENDVLIVHPYGAIYIAKVLRRSMIEMFSLNISRKEKDEKSKNLMEYIKGEDFRNGVEDSIYRTRELTKMLIKEAKQHQTIWLTRGKHYKAIHDNASRLELMTSGILKGLSVKAIQGQIKQKQLPPPSHSVELRPTSRRRTVREMAKAVLEKQLKMFP